MELIRIICIFLFFIIFNLISYSQGISENIKFYNHKDLFNDSVSFEDEQVLLKTHKKNSLFDVESQLNFLISEFKYEPKNFTKNIDSIIHFKINNKKFRIMIHIDSLPNGKWSLYDSLDKIRCEYYFINGKNIFSKFYDENEILIREFFYYQNDFLVDNWYYKNKIVKVSYKKGNLFQSTIYNLKGRAIINFEYDNKGKIIFINECYQENKYSSGTVVIDIMKRNKPTTSPK